MLILPFLFSIPIIIFLINQVFSNVHNYKSDSSLYQVNDNHYLFTAGYSFHVNEELSIKTSILLKAVSGAPLELDMNTNLWLKNIIGLGFSYRTSESYLAMVEVQVTPQLRFGYSYDMPFKLPNSNELFLRIEVGKSFPNNKSYKIF